MFAEIFSSDSDSDSENEEQDRKIRVEIKPLNNGSAPISASVDELRATVENLSLSPLGGALSVSEIEARIRVTQHQQSPFIHYTFIINVTIMIFRLLS